MRRRRFLSLSGASLAALALAPPRARSADFSGQVIELIIPFKEGGGSDTWARFNAPFFSRYLPGRPTVIVKNVPGGGSIAGANRFASHAKANGLTVLGTSASTQFPYLIGDPRVRYDYRDWRVLMAYGTGGVVYVSPRLGVRSAQDLASLRDRRLVYGSQGPTSLDLVPVLAFELLGLNVKTVLGMRGRGAGRLAFERGETNIDYQTSTAYLRNVEPLIHEGEAVPLFSWGTLDDSGQLTRDPSFPELPHFGEAYRLANGSAPSGLAWDAWFAFFIAGFTAQKLFVVPDRTPDDIVSAYQEAVRRMKQDSRYQATKQAALGDYEQLTGAGAERQYTLATHVPAEARTWVRNWLIDKFRLNLEG
jgi:tripartite-type tricarboxylate transporter receptor subunit TctC